MFAEKTKVHLCLLGKHLFPLPTKSECTLYIVAAALCTDAFQICDDFQRKPIFQTLQFLSA